MGAISAGEHHGKVLVVDDDADWREYLRLCLEDLGYETTEAADGQQALESLARERCSVVLLDLHMPGMDGFQLLERLPRNGPRVVLLTSAAPSEASSALQTGPHYYLPKGASREELRLLLMSLAMH